jgi:hypothetical protein
VSIPCRLFRVLLGGALVGGGALAVVGGLAVRGDGLVAVGLAATLAACTAAGIAREAPATTRGSAAEAAVWAAGGPAGVLLVVVGLSAVAGGVAAGVAVGIAFVAVAIRLIRGRRPRSAPGAATTPQRPVTGEVVRLPVTQHPARREASAGAGHLLPPVSTLTTRALGDEWVRTTAELAGWLSPAARASLVSRREEVLDELERRDPDGFGLWLAAGPAGGSDPAEFVRGGPARPGSIADTDAA